MIGQSEDDILSLGGGGAQQGKAWINPTLGFHISQDSSLESRALLWSPRTPVELELLGCDHENLAPVDLHLC